MSSISFDDIIAAYNNLPKQRVVAEIHCSPHIEKELVEVLEPAPLNIGNSLFGVKLVTSPVLPMDLVVLIDQYGMVMKVIKLINVSSSNG